MTLGNTQAGRPDGQCNREQTADGADPPGSLAELRFRSRIRGEGVQARVKRWGKSPPAIRVTGSAR